MNFEDMNRLASEYEAPEDKVDYVACFRSHLTGDAHHREKQAKLKATALAEISKSLRAHHPWEFEYFRGKSKTTQPYWSTAASVPKEIKLPGYSTSC